MDVFEAGGQPPPARHRGRNAVLAVGALVVVVLAVVGGGLAAAKILFPGHGGVCTSTDVADQKALTAFLQHAVDTTAPGPTPRQVLPLGCTAAGDSLGAHASIMDDPELGQMRAVLAQGGCALPDGIPATCTTSVGKVTVLVTVVNQPGSADGGYDLAMIRKGSSHR